MSRSRKKNAYTSICVAGNHGDVAKFKRQRARTERARVRCVLTKADPEQSGAIIAVELAPWDERSSPRDGKQWLGSKLAEAKRSGDAKRLTQMRRDLAK